MESGGVAAVGGGVAAVGGGVAAVGGGVAAVGGGVPTVGDVRQCVEMVEVLDVKGCKMAVWWAAYRLVRTLFSVHHIQQ